VRLLIGFVASVVMMAGPACAAGDVGRQLPQDAEDRVPVVWDAGS